ncbi:MAG: hypothetical protein K2W85_13105 [Phycisphaerales bacterium]|nr:hypothetical protein [Phycisphaerales bacterium]
MNEEMSQIDLLTSRIADGESTREDWAAFSELAGRNPQAWEQLAMLQRDKQSLSLAVGIALHSAENVDLPTRDAAASYFGRSSQPTTIGWRKFGAMGGWAAAAMVALAWIGSHNGLMPIRTSGPGTSTAGLIPAGYERVTSPDDAYRLYLDKGAKSGRIVGEVPKLWLVDSRPEETGNGYEVVYVRQIVERARVNDLVGFAQDENGRAMPVRMSAPRRPGAIE